MITTTTEAPSLADLTHDWKIVARQLRTDKQNEWRYTFADDPDGRRFRALRDDGTMSSVQAGGVVFGRVAPVVSGRRR